MSGLDSTAVLALTVAVLAAFTAVGVRFSRGRVGSVDDYLTARGSAERWPLTATLVASVMGVWILFNPAEAGIAFGGVSAVLGYAVGEAVPMLAYAKLAPRIREAIPKGHSLTEYAYARYGPAMYAFVLLVSLFYMFVFLAAELTAITGAHSLVAGVPRWQTAALVGGFVLLYTGYGGLRASIVTDAVQTAIVVPLLLLAFVGALFALGGPGVVWADVTASNPELVTVSLSNPTFLTGLQFGVWVSLAILGAELVNQVWWQRIYAAADPGDLPRAFGIAAGVNFVLVFLAGFFGVVAVSQASFGPESHAPANAVFVLLLEAFPAWLALAVVLLALLLVMSTADSLFNGMASVVTTDLPRLLDDPDDATLQLAARALTVIVALLAVYVALEARSVLRLFLLADLFGAAVAFPLLYGLFSHRVTGPAALAGGVTALLVGLVFFPNPVVRGGLAAVFGDLLPTPSFLVSFVGAAGVSVAVTVTAAHATSGEFDLTRLSTDVRSLENPRPDGGDVTDSGSGGSSEHQVE